MTTAEPPTIFDVLPGQQMPVSEVSPMLSSMWSSQFDPKLGAASEFRASQMNIILHLGLKTSPEEAKERFDAAIEFGQKYPCRIVVLCPMGRERSDRLLQGKIFSMCYIGESLRDQCCVEAVILGYPTREAGFLSSQVSIWLENDLPTYHWFNRIPAERITQMHMDFVKRCRRVIYDSTVEMEDANDLTSIEWPRPEGVIDLAWARLLPVRQSLGQHLSSIEPARLIDGLQKVEARAVATHKGEAANLVKWCRECLTSCTKDSQLDVEFVTGNCPDEHALELEWTYSNGHHLLWTLNAEGHGAQITADFGLGRTSAPMHVELLSGEKALAEAMFFA
ncbi:glucose-6-phosphate dehydrogenase assembly protein OpcA [Cerasicoccus fimbriatus]|uniref:glucose-6-phosphate dehydrogenase assembly protein OpcA n=1 Tax=Cerasicoccus fimbriatus TaxID=3014554 RepID=UPI0022B59B3B|nr:glucose-6-phosphate dehydrogenase assembly protein OpcA [Cerasicoccus sp. TK19100]